VIFNWTSSGFNLEGFINQKSVNSNGKRMSEEQQKTHNIKIHKAFSSFHVLSLLSNLHSFAILRLHMNKQKNRGNLSWDDFGGGLCFALFSNLELLLPHC